MATQLDSAFNTLYDAHEVAISVLDKEQRGPASSKQEDRLHPMALCFKSSEKRWLCARIEPEETIEDVAKRMLKRVKELPS